MIRRIYYYKNYYLNFYKTLDSKVQKKFNWTLQLIATLDKAIPKKYFQHITNSSGLYEIRVEVESDIYRVFCFFDKGNIVILIDGFRNKTRKTPVKELEMAERLKKQYFEEQNCSS